MPRDCEIIGENLKTDGIGHILQKLLNLPFFVMAESVKFCILVKGDSFEQYL
jgi:hypothetical protein